MKRRCNGCRDFVNMKSLKPHFVGGQKLVLCPTCGENNKAELANMEEAGYTEIKQRLFKKSQAIRAQKALGIQ